MGDILGGRRGPAHVVGKSVDTLAVTAVDLDERLFLASGRCLEELIVRALEPRRRPVRRIERAPGGVGHSGYYPMVP